MTEGGGPVGTGATTPLHSTTRRPWDGVRQHIADTQRDPVDRGAHPSRSVRGADEMRAVRPNWPLRAATCAMASVTASRWKDRASSSWSRSPMASARVY